MNKVFVLIMTFLGVQFCSHSVVAAPVQRYPVLTEEKKKQAEAYFQTLLNSKQLNEKWRTTIESKLKKLQEAKTPNKESAPTKTTVKAVAAPTKTATKAVPAPIKNLPKQPKKEAVPSKNIAPAQPIAAKPITSSTAPAKTVEVIKTKAAAKK